MTTGAARPAVVATVLAAAMLGVGCGKKGAPLAPFVRIPAAVSTIAATRLGTNVYVTLTVPATNIDTSIPVDISRIDVYGYTGRVAPRPAQWAVLGTVVATIPVVPPPLDAAGAPLPPADEASGGALPGTPVTIADTLTPDELIQGPVPPVDPRLPELVPLPLPGVMTPTVLRRFYTAIPFSQRGRPGVPGMQAELVLTMLPDPPTDVRVTYAPAALSLAWEPSGGLLGFLLDRALPPEPLPFDTLQPPGPVVPPPVDASVPPGPTMYNVYRELALDPFVLPPATLPSWRVTAPMALNPAPLAATAIADTVEFGRARCYTVRAQRGTAMSEPSAPACVTPIDVFPPAAPAGLAAVPSEGGISLIWEPNAELDLGGYLVLRREAGDATLRQLTDVPIGDARYRDITVQPGTRYIYSVVAVDTQLPLPNVSAQSELVEETAR